MYAREENLKSLDGICFGCRKTQQIKLKEEWHLNTLYKVGACPSCSYEHSIFVKRI